MSAAPERSLGKRVRRAAGGAAISRAAFVQARIREAIQRGRYRPSQRLLETEIAAWLEVSRTPVREALRRLEAEGLLASVPWCGVVVADLDRAQVMELYAMCAILEGAAAGLAAHHIGEAEIEVLEALHARAETEGEAETLAANNRDFHRAIYTAAHNRYLLRTLNALAESLALLPGTTFSLAGRAEAAQAEHAAILAGIRSRDPEAAERAARTHIQAAERARLRLLFAIEG